MHPIVMRAALSPLLSSRVLVLACLLALNLAGCKPTTPAPSPATQPAAAGEPPRTTQRAERYEREDRGFDPSTGASRRQSRSNRSHTAASTQPGVFDFYLLNLSWSPEFCATHAGSPECSAHPGFVVHGLWPQNADGTFPEDCSNAPGSGNPASLTDLIPTVSLVEHEWTTHGTCSGLAADAYFAEVRQAFGAVRIPAAFTAAQTTQTMLAPDAILSQFRAANPGFPAGSFALSCGSNFLTAVEACFDKSLHPEACQGVRTCRANAVKITPR